MKRFIKRIMICLASAMLVFGFSISPLFVSAEEVTETPEISTETEVVEEELDQDENGEKTGNNEILKSEQNTFESFLAWMEKEAKRYGYEDEYAKALESIKTAATTKQVTISTLVNVGLLVLGVGYIIYKKVRDKKVLKEASKLVSQTDNQLTKLNELVDATNGNSKTEQEIEKDMVALQSEMKLALSCLYDLINGFAHFVDGVHLKENKKDEVMRDCNSALKRIDGDKK